MTSETNGALRLAGAIDALTRFFGKAIAWLVLPMVLSLVWEVVARYFFNAPTVWAYDMTFMLYGSFFMIGSAWTLQRGGHIRTDVYYAKWSKRTPLTATTPKTQQTRRRPTSRPPMPLPMTRKAQPKPPPSLTQTTVTCSTPT